MNRKLLEQVADSLLANPGQFDHKQFRHEDSKAPAGIAGWICWLSMSKKQYYEFVNEKGCLEAFAAATYYAGLNTQQSIALFNPDAFEPYKVTAEKASAVVRYLAKTGVVDWSVKPQPDFITRLFSPLMRFIDRRCR